MKKFKYLAVGTTFGDIGPADLGIPVEHIGKVWISSEKGKYWQQATYSTFFVPFDELRANMPLTVGVRGGHQRWRFELVDFDRAGLLCAPLAEEPKVVDFKMEAANDDA